eukprot:19942_1
MATFRKRKNNPIKSSQPLKKKKLNSQPDINSFLDDSDNETDTDTQNITSIHSDQEREDINNIINQVIEEEKDLQNETTNTNYNELDEFDEVSNINNNSNDNNDSYDFLELGSDNDNNEEPNTIETLAFLEDTKRKQIQSDVSKDMYEEKRLNDLAQKSEINFIFPSYKRLLREKTEAPNLSLLKTRIENVLEILSNFKILRDTKHSRKEYISLLSHSFSRYYGYNLDLMNMFLTLFNPNECLAFLESNEQSRPLTIRTNTLKCRRRDLAKLLIDRGVNLDPLAKWTKTGLKIIKTENSSNIPIGATPEYLAGYYMIQSAASLLPTLALDIKGKMKVLDMCCAPGGKTTHIAQLLRDTGVVVANDLNHERLKAVYGNVHRMGLKNVVIVNMDGRELSQHYHPIFDRVLLDAPCSCLGVISRDPSIKFSKKFNDVIKMSTVQKELILSAIDCCKVGGYIVYSTCSISPYENEGVVYHALEKRYVKVVDTGLQFGENGFSKFKHLKFHNDLVKTKRYYPHIHNLDGFYVAKLYKCDKGKRGKKKIVKE